MAGYSLKVLAAALNADLQGDEEKRVFGMGTLEMATADQLSFLSNPKYSSQLARTKAGVVILNPALAKSCPSHALIVENPYLAYAKASALFCRKPKPVPGIHPSAQIDTTAVIPASCCIGPGVVVGKSVVLGEGVQVGAHVYLGPDVSIGNQSKIDPLVVIHHGCELGHDVHVQSQAVIGGDGFGFAPSSEGWQPISQLGRVVIGNHVHIGVSTSIDRGSIEDTRLDDHVIIDNQVQIAHNVQVGKGTAIAGCVGIAGSTRIGAKCTIAGMAGIAGHLVIVDGVHIGMQAQVTRSISKPGEYASGTGLFPKREWLRIIARWRRWFKEKES